MIVNKLKFNLIKSSKTKPIKPNKDISRNNQENIYFQNIIKTNNTVKYDGKIKPQIKNINENIQKIFASDESKKKALKFIFQHNQKEKNNNKKNSKTNFQPNKSLTPALLTEPTNINVIFKAPSKKTKKKVLTDMLKDNNINNKNKKLNNIKNKLSKKITDKEKITTKNENNDNHKKITKNRTIDNYTIYNDNNDNVNDNKTFEYSDHTKKYLNEFDDNLITNNNNNNSSNNYNIIKRNDMNRNHHKNIYKNSIEYRTIYNYKRNNTIDLYDFSTQNNNNTINNNNNNNNISEYITDNLLYNITKKLNIPKPLNTRKNTSNLLDNNIYKGKTQNSFYIKKKALACSVKERINKKNNIINDITEPIIGYNNKNSNKTLDNKRHSRRKNNRIRIIKNSNGIQEFNINLAESENEEDYIQKNNYDKDDDYKIKYMTINNANNEIFDNRNNYYCTKDIPSFNINTDNNNNNNSMKYFTKNNFDKNNNIKDDELFYDEILTERFTNNNFKKNKFGITSIDLYNDNNDNNNRTFDENFRVNRRNILIKKRPLNEIKNKNISNKKLQNLKYIEKTDNEKYKEKKNNLNENINNKKKNLKSNNLTNINALSVNVNNLSPSQIINFKYDPINYNPAPNPDIHTQIITADNINSNSNIIIIKKEKGTILNQISTDEDIDKINKELKKAKITINNAMVQLIPINDNNNDDNSILTQQEDKKILIEENKKLKNENELLSKKDKMKAELISKLDKEKQKLIEEINKLTKEKNEQKLLNEKLITQNEKIKEENERINNALNEMMKLNRDDEEEMIEINGMNFVDIESINDGQTDKIEELNEMKEISQKEEN